ncbi:TetR/AcrR family transcriptional regulator [Shinella sp. PSBB067]|uniref:TetR/AcrR family transcriptional regulator n=1 Tax=unclassified Shinella TaxID=2643062 RepID=UPI00193C1F3E|nr:MULTISPECIES: TetR/AcrR family transcriptional regulator [unclassified Shinella]MBN9053846.1 TetR/AcrR family transcriptional regulator [Hyphomicrobiales bacterium]QRI62112.1 TetR/AcrR family transcriptional regulator [Shinella sp. PSBB067]
MHTTVEKLAAPHAGRRAAGEDPAKREQILDGAKRVFMEQGFEAASMNDITRAAGVSKGTIYVYFENKEDLFGYMIERERSRITETVRHALDGNKPITETLADFGMLFATHMTADQTIRAMRMVIAANHRLPMLCSRFFSATPINPVSVLQEYLDRQVAAGIIACEDTVQAAKQFIELTTVGLFKPRIFGSMEEVPPRSAIERNVTSAIRVFLAAYGTKPLRPDAAE